MATTLESTLTSLYLLYTTSILSFLLARFIIARVKKHGPFPFASKAIKYNSVIYSLLSLLLCLAITFSTWDEITNTASPTLRTLICSITSSTFDKNLRLIFHLSKLYEYIDIFNVLAAGGIVNTHFAIHHFTVRPSSPLSPSYFPI